MDKIIDEFSSEDDAEKITISWMSWLGHKKLRKKDDEKKIYFFFHKIFTVTKTNGSWPKIEATANIIKGVEFNISSKTNCTVSPLEVDGNGIQKWSINPDNGFNAFSIKISKKNGKPCKFITNWVKDLFACKPRPVLRRAHLGLGGTLIAAGVLGILVGRIDLIAILAGLVSLVGGAFLVWAWLKPGFGAESSGGGGGVTVTIGEPPQPPDN